MAAGAKLLQAADPIPAPVIQAVQASCHEVYLQAAIHDPSNGSTL